MRSPNLSKVIRTRLVFHKCIFKAMGMRHRPQIGHIRMIGNDIANDEVPRPLQVGQDQVGVPKVPLVLLAKGGPDKRWT